MDLLFKNPTYFFETYFAFSPIGFLIAFASFVVLLAILCRKRFDSLPKQWIFIVLASLYFAVIIGVTLLNTNRNGNQSVNLNPVNNIQELFTDMRDHQVRGCLTNMAFFLPFGIFAAVYFRKHKILYSTLTALCASIIIEVFQYILHRGCAETMDVICNMLGALLGASITVLILYIFNRNHHKAKEH